MFLGEWAIVGPRLICGVRLLGPQRDRRGSSLRGEESGVVVARKGERGISVVERVLAACDGLKAKLALKHLELHGRKAQRCVVAVVNADGPFAWRVKIDSGRVDCEALFVDAVAVLIAVHPQQIARADGGVGVAD